MHEEFNNKRSIFFENTKYLFDCGLPKVSSNCHETLTKKYEKYDLKFSSPEISTTPIQKRIEDFHKIVTKSLDEYFQFKYGISDEQLGIIIKNTNNFKLKHNNFQRVVQLGKEFYYDDDVLFLEVDNITLTVNKRWSE